MNSQNPPISSPKSVYYCINPWCQQRQNPDSVKFCQACGTSLLINERYQLILPLRGLDEPGNAELFAIEDWGVDAAERGTPKVLKVLKPTNHPTLIRLFQQEARVLTQLSHPGIPKVESEGYFTVAFSNGSKQLHCLVMEKVEGLNLEQWLDENGPISQDLCISWLQQLAEILALIHQNGLFHRDIKPSNIMLKPDGKLVLIDFGTAREISPTLLEKLERRNVTRVISKGYTSPEQCQGQAIPKSDLFSLGRTFVYLLTGFSPTEFEESQTGQLIGWQGFATALSKPLVDLIDQLMAPESQHRPRDPQALLRRLAEIQSCGTTELPDTNPDASTPILLESNPPENQTLDWSFPSLAFPFSSNDITQREDNSQTISTHDQEVITNDSLSKKVGLLLNYKKVKWGFVALFFLGFVSFKLVAPQLAVTFNNQASDNYEAGQLENAQFDIKLALMLDPQLSEAHYIEGLISDARQDFNLARTQYEKAMSSLPDKVHNNLGRLDILEGNYSDAILRLQKGLQLVEEVKLKSALHKNLGWALLELRDYSTAETQLRQAISLDSNRASAYCLMAQVLEAKGDKSAGAYWGNCLKYAQNDPRLPEVISWVIQARQRQKFQYQVIGQK